jgi:hypothetical protein
MSEELKSRSQMKRVACQKPELLIQELDGLRVTVSVVTRANAEFRAELKAARDALDEVLNSTCTDKGYYACGAPCKEEATAAVKRIDDFLNEGDG